LTTLWWCCRGWGLRLWVCGLGLGRGVFRVPCFRVIVELFCVRVLLLGMIRDA